MQQKVCPICEAQEMFAKTDIAPAQAKIVEWTCGFCGHKETDTIQMTELGGYVTETERLDHI
jgi:C4-type Zn-finger protein